MQPTYLPWAGYFNLIAQADRFYYLDDAQYERGTWQQRNRILRDGQPSWLTVPVRRERFGQLIRDVQVDPLSPTWRRKHAESIRYAYLRAPHRAALQPIVETIMAPENVCLADLNIALIDRLCTMLGISTPRARTSEMDLGLPRSHKLVEICGRAGCDEYLSTPGAAEYLTEDGFSKLTDVRLLFQDYNPGSYLQMGSKQFISHLSIIDVIAHIGNKSAGAYVRNGSEGI